MSQEVLRTALTLCFGCSFWVISTLLNLVHGRQFITFLLVHYVLSSTAVTVWNAPVFQCILGRGGGCTQINLSFKYAHGVLIMRKSDRTKQIRIMHRIRSKAEMSWKYWKRFICLPSFSEFNRDHVNYSSLTINISTVMRSNQRTIQRMVVLNLDSLQTDEYYHSGLHLPR